MFRKLAGLAVVACLFIAGTASAQGNMVGSAHDFSGDAWNTSGQMCAVCHTTHNGTVVQGGPLWDHDVTTAGAGSFTLYTGVDLATSPDDPEAVGGISLLCLSCHDGTVALDAFGGGGGGDTIAVSYGYANVTTDLSDDHPIAIAYNNTLQTDMADPSSASSGVTGGSTIDADMLFGGKVECASCHDVHRQESRASLLIADNTGSAMCQTCHAK
jgi:predicted CXXCH cytochrome family protein